MARITYDESRGLVSNLDTSEIFSLNETGKFFFEEFSKNRHIAEVAQELATRFKVSEIEVNKDASDFYEFLEEKGLLPKSNGLEQVNVFDQWQVKTPIIHIIQNCNSPCNICDCWKVKESSYHSRQQLLPLFEILVKKGADSIMISGGEPLLHPEIEGILQDIKTLGMSRMLNTNGFLLGKNKRILDLNLEQIVVSMDGFDSKSYQAIRGANAFNLVWKNIKSFKEHCPSTHVGIRITINSFNFNKIPLLVALAKQNGVDGIGFNPADVDSESFSRSMNDHRKDQLMNLMIPSLSEIESLLSTFIPGSEFYDLMEKEKELGYLAWGPAEFIECLMFYRDLRIGQVQSYGSSTCLFPKISMLLDYDGSLRNCFYSKSFGQLNQLAQADWSFSDSLKDLKLSDKCSQCRGKVFCDIGRDS